MSRDFSSDWSEIWLDGWSIYEISLERYVFAGRLGSCPCNYEWAEEEDRAEAEGIARTKTALVALWLGGAPTQVIGEVFLIGMVMPRGFLGEGDELLGSISLFDPTA